MNLSTSYATEPDKVYFFKLYCDAMRTHIEAIWGWDETWQKADFEERWLLCSNQKILFKGSVVGYFQTIESEHENYIMMFILDKATRSRGIGKETLNMIQKISPCKPIALKVFKTNHRALSFFKNNGFSITHVEDSFYAMRAKVVQ